MGEVSSKQYIDVRLGSNLYGIDIKYIDNIIVMHNITRVPKSQPYFLGVINLRGEIIPIMSLRRKLGLEDDEFTESTRIMIIKPEPSAAPVGLIVDEVNEVITLEEENIEKFNYTDETKADYSEGIGKHGDDLINILNILELIYEKNE